MVLKGAFGRMPSDLSVEVFGFAVAFLIGLVLNYFLGGGLFGFNTLIFGLLGAILARLRAGSKRQQTSVHASSAGDATLDLKAPDSLLSAAELRKLNLEIEELQLRSQWERRVARYIPPVTVLIAVASLLIGLDQFRTQQRTQHAQDIAEQQKDRDAREKELRQRFLTQFRADVEQLLQFATDVKRTASSASFLLLDLKTLLNTKVNETQEVSEIYPEYEGNVTENLVRTITYDCDFSKNKRDLDFAMAVLENWPKYSTYLKDHLGSLEKILGMHITALRRLRDDNPGYFESINNEEDGYYVDPRFDKQPGAERLYQHFLAIKTSFVKHIQLLDGNATDPAKKLRELVLRKFQAALCNRGVATDILQTYFEDEPCD